MLAKTTISMPLVSCLMNFFPYRPSSFFFGFERFFWVRSSSEKQSSEKPPKTRVFFPSICVAKPDLRMQTKMGLKIRCWRRRLGNDAERVE